jgi:hypothetical protein
MHVDAAKGERPIAISYSSMRERKTLAQEQFTPTALTGSTFIRCKNSLHLSEARAQTLFTAHPASPRQRQIQSVQFLIK